VPVTPRGAGTGNYGQAMPLSGGVVLNLADMTREGDRPAASSPRPAPSSPKIDEQTRARSAGDALAPLDLRTASIGGFIAGGSGGVGSIRWGGLRDIGNISLRSSPWRPSRACST
jgi:FAD/FMN-containing dehydrogenase